MKKTPAIIVTLIVLLAASLTAQENNAKPSAAEEIHAAAVAGDLSRVRALLEADPALLESNDYLGFTPLHRACYARQAAVANYLIDKGANVNARDYFQMTPLHRASFVAGQDLALIQRLIDKGAEVNAQAINGLTPLHWAAHSGDLKVARLLIDHGADVNAQFSGALDFSSISGTVLQVAINYAPNDEMAKFLVENGAKLNSKDSSGNTELHLAALKGYAALTQLLVKHGTGVNAVNKYNRTALYYAAIHGYRSVADVLVAAGAKTSAIVETNYGKAPQLSAPLKEGEAYLWYLGGLYGGGYAVKTKNHLLIFDKTEVDESAESGLANGHLNPNELSGQKITVFITKILGEQYQPRPLELAKRMPGITLAVDAKPGFTNADGGDIPPCRVAAPDEDFVVDGVRVHAIPAAGRGHGGAVGVGYLVEADGIKIFHAGFHAANNQTSQSEKYRRQIDFLKPCGPIDIAILSVDGHLTAAYEPYLYLLDQLAPKAVYLMGGDYVTDQYPVCVEVLRARNVPVNYPEGGRAMGERFHFVRESTNAPAGSAVNSVEQRLIPVTNDFPRLTGDYLGQPPPPPPPRR